MRSGLLLGATRLTILGLLFFVTSSVSVVTGSTSVITVPLMFQFGIDAHRAVATNMFALTLMSVGGFLPFAGENMGNRKRLPILIGVTLVGSAIGAVLLLITPSGTVPLVVSASIIGVAAFSTTHRRFIVEMSGDPSRTAEVAGYFLTFALGIYGGLFSGGYVTILTAVFVAAFRMTFIEAVATTKLMNIFSSAIATVIFLAQGIVDYRIGLALGFTMFLGAMLGARFARRLGNLWIRRIYLAAVWALSIKTLIFDVLLHGRKPAESR